MQAQASMVLYVDAKGDIFIKRHQGGNFEF